LRKIIKNFNYTFSENQFIKLIQHLNTKKNQIWIAPLVQIYKYEEEYKLSELRILKKNEGEIILKLKVNTDPKLYNQELSLIVPHNVEASRLIVHQNGREIKTHQNSNQELVINVVPENSKIEIKVI